jgi:hypothetical protein
MPQTATARALSSPAPVRASVKAHSLRRGRAPETTAPTAISDRKCSKCEPGTFTNASNLVVCLPCGVGQYQEQTRQSACLKHSVCARAARDSGAQRHAGPRVRGLRDGPLQRQRRRHRVRGVHAELVDLGAGAGVLHRLRGMAGGCLPCEECGNNWCGPDDGTWPRCMT